MAGTGVRCCGCRGERSMAWRWSYTPWRNHSLSQRRHVSTWSLCWASRVELGKGQSPSLGVYTPLTWLATKNEMRNWDSEYRGWLDDAVKCNSALQSGLLRTRLGCLTKRAISGLHVLRHREVLRQCLLVQTRRPRNGDGFPESSVENCNASLPQRADPSCGRYGGAKHAALQRNFGWLLLGKQIREGYLLQDLGQREQRPTRTVARASGDTPVCG